ncbi:MAG: hypothetical protein R3Y26_00620 [Rikenellaceae bacterium]
MKKIFLVVVSLLLCVGTVSAKADENISKITTDTTTVKEDKNQLTPIQERRVDREINKKKFMLKGEYMLGATASYNSLNSTNAEYLTLITNMNVEGSITSIKPFAAYVYRDNRAVGVRFGYTKYSGVVESTTLDLGESNDMTFDAPYLKISSDNYTYAIFHRAYAPLDDRGNFGLFAEVELYTTQGISSFAYESNDAITVIHNDSQSYGLSFNPGISAFLLNNVCASLSFQFGGLSYTNIKQYNNNLELVGERDSSKMRFMFNVLAINFGITVHLWK